ncbi:MAG TPA: hypothetical protein VGJ82_14980, partial [Thermoanaerobaculia bacterium]
MRPLLPLLLVAAIAVPATGLTLGAERRAVPMGAMTDAAWDQIFPMVASAGDDFVAIWEDRRSSHDVYGYNGGCYAVHISADGTASPAAG